MKYHEAVKKYIRKQQKEQYEYEANRSALLWLGIMLLLSLWLYAEVKHAKRTQGAEYESKSTTHVGS